MASTRGRPPMTRFPLVPLREWRHWRAPTQKELAEAAELFGNYVYYQDALGTTGVLASPAGRAVLLPVVESLYGAGEEPGMF